MKRQIILLAILCFAWCLNGVAQQSSVAYRDNQVRFSVISDGTIRMEWNAEGKFTDAPSFVAVCREYPSTEYQVKESRNTVEINTRNLTLKYRKGTGQFNADNLSICSTVPTGRGYSRATERSARIGTSWVTGTTTKPH